MRRVTVGKVFWLATYATFITGVVIGVFEVRRRTVLELSKPAAAAEWREWREAARRETTAGPVRRRLPASAEPPTLVLLRDHFYVVLSAAIVFGSLLFVMFGVAVRGLVARPSPN